MRKNELFTVSCIWLNRTQHNVHSYAKFFLIVSLLYSLYVIFTVSKLEKLVCGIMEISHCPYIRVYQFPNIPRNRLRAFRPSQQSSWGLQSFGIWNSATSRWMNTLQRGCLYFYFEQYSVFLTNHHHSPLHFWDCCDLLHILHNRILALFTATGRRLNQLKWNESFHCSRHLWKHLFFLDYSVKVFFFFFHFFCIVS